MPRFFRPWQPRYAISRLSPRLIFRPSWPRSEIRFIQSLSATWKPVQNMDCIWIRSPQPHMQTQPNSTRSYSTRSTHHIIPRSRSSTYLPATPLRGGGVGLWERLINEIGGESSEGWWGGGGGGGVDLATGGMVIEVKQTNWNADLPWKKIIEKIKHKIYCDLWKITK